MITTKRFYALEKLVEKKINPNRFDCQDENLLYRLKSTNRRAAFQTALFVLKLNYLNYSRMLILIILMNEIRNSYVLLSGAHCRLALFVFHEPPHTVSKFPRVLRKRFHQLNKLTLSASDGYFLNGNAELRNFRLLRPIPRSVLMLRPTFYLLTVFLYFCNVNRTNIRFRAQCGRLLTNKQSSPNRIFI